MRAAQQQPDTSECAECRRRIVGDGNGWHHLDGWIDISHVARPNEGSREEDNA